MPERRPTNAERIKLVEQQTAQSPLGKGIEEFNRVKAQLMDDVEDNKFVYVGSGAEGKYETTRGRFRTVYTTLRREEGGYTLHYLKLPHPDPDVDTPIFAKVLTKKDVPYQEVWANRDRILKMWLDAQTSSN